MHPAIRSGWFVLVEPNSPVQIGELVVVVLADGRSTIKEYLWVRDDEYTLGAVDNQARLVLSKPRISQLLHIAAILPPSSWRA